MPMSYLTKACEVADKVVGFHLEPIGWQINKERGITDDMTVYQEEHAIINDYSQNYYKLLLQAEDNGLIKIHRVAPSWLTAPENGYSLVHWSCLQPGEKKEPGPGPPTPQSSCPLKCSSCRAGSAEDGGTAALDGGVCRHYCSMYGACGLSSLYQHGGVDCTGCGAA